MSEPVSDKFLSVVFKTARFVGVPYTRDILLTIYLVVLHLISNVYYDGTFLVTLFKSNNLTSLLAVIPYLNGVLILGVKITNLYLHYDDFVFIRKKLILLEENIENPYHRAYLNNRISNAKRTSVLYALCLIACDVGAAVTAISSDGQVLMFQVWCPIDFRQSKATFYSIILFQLFAILVITYQDGLTDILRIASIYIVTGHFHLLSDTVSHLGYDTSKSHDKNFLELVHCIKYHQTLLELVDSLQKIISKLFLMNLLVISVNICAMLFGIVIIQQTVVQSLCSYAYIVVLLSQLLVQCHFGSGLHSESQNLMVAVYSCNWMDQSQTFKRTFLIYLQRSHKDIELAAGGVMPLTLTTFVQVLKSSYSLLALLKQVYK